MQKCGVHSMELVWQTQSQKAWAERWPPSSCGSQAHSWTFTSSSGRSGLLYPLQVIVTAIWDVCERSFHSLMSYVCSVSLRLCGATCHIYPIYEAALRCSSEHCWAFLAKAHLLLCSHPVGQELAHFSVQGTLRVFSQNFWRTLTCEIFYWDLFLSVGQQRSSVRA